MNKEIFIERLYVEIASGLISDSVFENKPIIDLFDSKKSDRYKISDYIKSEFNYAFRVIYQEDRSVKQLLTGEKRNIPNKYIEAFHLLNDVDIQNLALDVYLTFFVGKEAEYLHYVMEYLNDNGSKLNDQDAHKYLLLMNLNPVEKYRGWFARVRPCFLTYYQIESFINRA
jgi:hypothetical protein